MRFIRYQRTLPLYDANTHHVVYGQVRISPLTPCPCCVATWSKFLTSALPEILVVLAGSTVCWSCDCSNHLAGFFELIGSNQLCALVSSDVSQLLSLSLAGAHTFSALFRPHSFISESPLSCQPKEPPSSSNLHGSIEPLILLERQLPAVNGR